MEKHCANHSERKALSFCHNCGEYYCDKCLNEGKEFYYCNKPTCSEKYKEESKSIVNKQYPIYASFTDRFVAYTIDFIILFIFNSILFYILLDHYSQLSKQPEVLGYTDVIYDLGFFSILRFPPLMFISLLYFTFMERSERMGTFGKSMQGIVVISDKGEKITFLRALARNSCKILSSVSIIGMLLPLFHKQKKALHDLICGTLVLNTNALKENLNDQNVFSKV